MRQVPALAVLLVAIAGRLSCQTIVQAPAGLLTGVVLDSITGNPVGYALVIAEGVGRVFASEAGRFSLGGLPEGRLSLRVQQIGYRSVTSQLLVKTREGAGASLTIRLTRQPLVLPSLSARAPDCRSEGAESEGTLIEEVFKNAERLLVLQKDYPYQASMREINSVFDARETLLEQKVDTTSFDSRYLSSYHRGRVLVRTGRLAAREYATYFSPADLAAPEFRRSHCFWFDGTDDADGVPAYRIAFRPLVRVKSVDWAGSLVVDSATRHLLRSEAHLVNLPSKGTGFREAGCLVMYMQVVPTLVHEFQARCRTVQSGTPPTVLVQRWTLLQHRFLGKHPDPAPQSREED